MTMKVRFNAIYGMKREQAMRGERNKDFGLR